MDERQQEDWEDSQDNGYAECEGCGAEMSVTGQSLCLDCRIERDDREDGFI